MLRRFLFGFVSVLPLLMAGCGGRSDSTQTGVFLDASGVEGLQYQTPTQSGTTDSAGSFRYLPGEQVVFFIGQMEIGRAAGAARVTAFDLAGVSVPLNETEFELLTPSGRGLNRAINLTTFLQTIDQDADVSNGIFIPPVLRSMQARNAVKFALTVDTFRTHPTLLTYMGQARTAGVWGGARAIKNSGFAANALYRGLNLTSEPQARSEARTKTADRADTVETYTYNDKGQLIEEIYINPFEDFYQKTIYKYDDEGKFKVISTYLSPDVLLNEIFISYDSNGHEVKSETVQLGWGVRWSTETVRDISGNPIEIKRYESGVLSMRTLNSFDNSGLLIQSQNFDGDGQLTGRQESEYGLDFNLIKYKQFDSTQALELAIHSSYDNNGMIVNETVYDRLGQVSGSLHYSRDSNGNILRMETKDGAGLQNYYAIYTYDITGRKTSEKIYGRNGILTDAALSYDANGRLTIKSTDYKVNGVSTETITYKSVAGWVSSLTSFRQGPR